MNPIEYLESIGITALWGEILTGLIMILITLILYFIVKKYILNFLHQLFLKTKTDWDRILYEEGVFNQLPFLVPLLFLYYGVSLFPSLLVAPARGIIRILVFLIMVIFIDRLLTGFLVIYNSYPISYKRPIKGYVQIVKILLYLAASVIIISILLDQSPWVFLSGLGALTAVLILIFQGTILSFIASLQIMGNDMFRVGDWLEVPKFQADGSVIEVALHTIKIRNWDNTVTTIPTHKLIEDSFKNWRGMSESGGRRIKRSLLIDQTSITFLDDEHLDQLEEIHLLKDYLKEKREELKEYNQRHGYSKNPINGRRLTNIGTFRQYIVAYLRQNPKIHQELMFLIRQLQPTTEGLPLEIYVFTNDVNWVNYENIQSDIFDHLLAVVPEFGLRVFQKPTGQDLLGLRDYLEKGENLPIKEEVRERSC